MREVLICRLSVERQQRFRAAKVDLVDFPLDEIQNGHLLAEKARYDLRIHPKLLILIPSDLKQLRRVGVVKAEFLHCLLQAQGPAATAQEPSMRAEKRQTERSIVRSLEMTTDVRIWLCNALRCFEAIDGDAK
jgi:hypothetical protein